MDIGSECYDESNDRENDFVNGSDLDDDLREIDAHNQLYMLERILSFHGWYKCGSPYLLGTEKGMKCIDNVICYMCNTIKNYPM